MKLRLAAAAVALAAAPLAALSQPAPASAAPAGIVTTTCTFTHYFGGYTTYSFNCRNGSGASQNVANAVISQGDGSYANSYGVTNHATTIAGANHGDGGYSIIDTGAGFVLNPVGDGVQCQATGGHQYACFWGPGS